MASINEEGVGLLQTSEDAKLLKTHRKVAYAAGNFLTVLAVSLWFPYAITFFTNVVGLSPKNAGNIVLLGQAGGAISTLVIGMWSNQCRCRIPGRRKIFHLLGITVTATVFFFLWFHCLGCENAAPKYVVLYYGVFAIIFQFGWASTQVAQLALMPELSSKKKTLVELNSLRYSFTLIANLLVFCCVWGLLEKFGASITSDISKNDRDVFWIMAIIISVVGFLVSLPFQFLIPEKPNANLRTLKWYKWFTSSRIYLTALLLIGARYIVLMPQTYMPDYFLKTLKMDKSSIAKGPLILFIGGFISSLFVKRFRNFLGDRMTFFLGMVTVWGAVIFFWVKEQTGDQSSHFNWHRDCIYIATLLLGCGGTIVLVIALSMVSFLVKDYKGSSAFVYGWVLFADRLSNGVGVYVIQQLTPSDTPSDTPSELLEDYYRHVMVYLPLGASAVGLGVIVLMALIDWRNEMSQTPAADHPSLTENFNPEYANGTQYGINVANAEDVSLSYDD